MRVGTGGDDAILGSPMTVGGMSQECAQVVGLILSACALERAPAALEPDWVSIVDSLR